MIDAVVGLVALMRRSGIEVGTDRTITAARSLRHVDLTNRTATRRALKLALVGHRHDERAFDTLFDRWFDGSLTTDREAAPSPADDADASTLPLADAELTLDTERRLHEAVYVDDPSERIGVTTDREPSANDGATGPTSAVHDPDGRRIRTSIDATASVGAETAGSGADTVRRVDGAADPLSLPDAPNGDETDTFDERALEGLLEQLTAARRHRLELLDELDRPTTSAHFTTSRVLANPFDHDEQRTLEQIVGLLRPQLTGSTGWRRRPGPRGEVDLRRTLRRAATTGGVPVQLGRRHAPPTRAEVVVLLDTSLSVRPSARLMLHLAHRLRSRIGRVRVLAFIDRCVDVTDVIRHADLATALGRLLDDAPGGPLDPARSSDYGAALHSLWSRHGAVLGPRTTVFVLGDGRSNGRDPGLGQVRDLTARCRRTIWLTPEPVGAWAFGHGEMAAYAEAVDVAWPVRSLDDLAALARSGAVRPPALARRTTPAPTR